MAERLHSAALHLLRRVRAEDDPSGLSPSRFSALSLVALEGPISVGALAETEGVATPTMSRLIDGLERDGLVRRGPDPEDRRGVLVTSTPKGERALQAARRVLVASLADRLRSLSPDERAALATGAELFERVTR